MPQGVKGELTFVGSLFILGFLIFIDTYNSEQSALNLTVSPKIFPYVVASILMILSAVLFVRVLSGDHAIPDGLTEEDVIEPWDFKTFGIVFASLLAFLLLIERAGFIIAASITFFGITVAFDNKKHLRSIIFGTLFITLVYFSFTKFLNVQLPAGIFEGNK